MKIALFLSYYFSKLLWQYPLVMFTSVSDPCEFTMMPDVYILLSPEKEEVHSSS